MQSHLTCCLMATEHEKCDLEKGDLDDPESQLLTTSRMRQGFLGPQSSDYVAVEKVAEPSPPPSPPAPPMVQTAVPLTPEKWQENFAQCLSLLKGPADETRSDLLLLLRHCKAFNNRVPVLYLMQVRRPFTGHQVAASVGS